MFLVKRSELNSEIQPINLWDVDNTLVNAHSMLNVPLCQTFLRYGLNQMTLQTSYDVTYRLRVSIEKNVSRMDIVRRLRQEGFDIQAVVVSASPYEEEPCHLGQYYQEKILPIELKAKEHFILNGSSALRQLLKTPPLSEFAQAEVDELEARASQPLLSFPVWQGNDYKGGKQHLLIHTITSYIAKGHRHFIVLDDKPEVLNVVRRAQQEKLFGQDVYLYAFEVNFNPVTQETEKEYELRLKEAYQALQLPFPSPVRVQPIKQPKLCLDVSDYLENFDLLHTNTFAVYHIDQYHKVYCLEDSAKKSSPRLLSSLPSSQWEVISGNNTPLLKLVGWLNIMQQASLPEQWNYHFLGIPSEESLKGLERGFKGEVRLAALIQGYQCLRAIYQMLNTIPTPLIDFSLLSKSRSYFSSVKVYQALLQSPQHLLLKLVLIDTWLTQESKIKALLAPILTTYQWDLSSEWMKLLLSEFPCVEFSALKIECLAIANQIAEKNSLEVILQQWYTTSVLIKENIYVATGHENQQMFNINESHPPSQLPSPF